MIPMQFGHALGSCLRPIKVLNVLSSLSQKIDYMIKKIARFGPLGRESKLILR